MKKIICSFAFAATLIAVSAADAVVDSPGSSSQTSCLCPNGYTQSKCLTWMSQNCYEHEVETEFQDKNTEEYTDKGETGGTTTTATVSSCPSGTTKSSDGCCCVNN